jgi:hypothetical protein
MNNCYKPAMFNCNSYWGYYISCLFAGADISLFVDDELYDLLANKLGFTIDKIKL